jgi:Flp pilus assembly protein TadG
MLNIWIRDERGATLAYVALLMTAMLGVVGLSYDLGRHYILSSELQKAADAAAIAGAYQLDEFGDQDAVAARVQRAVITAPITENAQKLGAEAGIVEMRAPVLLATIPADDSLPITNANAGPPFRYVQVTTQAVVSNNLFGRLVGQPATITLERQAVARKGAAVCQVTALAVCNPLEAVNGSGAAFPASEYYSRQIIVRQIGNGNQSWAPGNFGFLDVPGFGNGAGGLAAALGSAGSPICFSTQVETEPGQTNGARNALNTRFDMYQNPFFRNANRDPRYPPAENVTKGYNTQTGGYCNNPAKATAAQPLIKGLPRDTNLLGALDFGRFGNGTWACADYWQTVHPTHASPAGCGGSPGTPTSAISRFEVYRHEIDNGIIPSGSGSGATAREAGTPQCATSANPPQSPVGGDLSTDRRVVTMAVLNCIEHDVRGASDVPVEVFLNGFLTEPVLQEPSNPANGDIVLEIVGSSIAGNGGVAPVRAKDWVELVR